jgi:hypothetical protein
MTNQVVPQELHDECGVLVTLLAEGVELYTMVSQHVLGPTCRSTDQR